MHRPLESHLCTINFREAWTSSLSDGGSLMYAVFSALHCLRNIYGNSRRDYSPEGRLCFDVGKCLCLIQDESIGPEQ